MILIKTYLRRLIRGDNMDDDNERREVFRTIFIGDYIIVDYLNKEHSDNIVTCFIGISNRQFPERCNTNKEIVHKEYRRGLSISMLEDRVERRKLKGYEYNLKREDG